jgi:hypothetical protein
MPTDEFTMRVSFLIGFFVLFLFVGRYFRRDPMLDAIPTVGVSDPILSYFSALQFIFDGVRMLKDRYQKVISPPYMYPSSYQSDDAPTFRQDQVC